MVVSKGFSNWGIHRWALERQGASQLDSQDSSISGKGHCSAKALWWERCLGVSWDIKSQYEEEETVNEI